MLRVCSTSFFTSYPRCTLLRLLSTSTKMADESSSERLSSRRPSPHVEWMGVDASCESRRSLMEGMRGRGDGRVVDERESSSTRLSEGNKEQGSVFDICPVYKNAPVKLKSSLLSVNKEKRKEAERMLNEKSIDILRPGMVILRNYIDFKDQVNIVKRCRDLGIGPGGFYQPGYRDGGKLKLHMMCLGKDWDPESKSYSDHRSYDGAKPPPIPDEFTQLVKNAISVARNHINASIRGPKKLQNILPEMSPDLCIVNFYTQTGKLGLHQDKDETEESIEGGLPVVSFSLGDTAEFLYNESRNGETAKKIQLKSGDVLIFGGPSRMIFHGVPEIVPTSAPQFLLNETSLRTGRLNLTFRKY